jgi:shikimate dehydrogenase
MGDVLDTTTVAGVIGHPIRHSLSPLLFNAAFAASDLDWVYAAFDVAEGAGADAIAAMRAIGLGGLSVTMPHKDVAAAAVDRLSVDAEALAAVNCVAWDGDELVGHNTDGPGFVDALQAEAGWSPEGRRCVVLGGGGAARAIARALGASGADEVVVVNRTEAKAVRTAAVAGRAGRVGRPEEVAEAELVVNATSVGMGASPGDTDPLPIDRNLLHAGQLVVDAVYLPRRTPLLAAATDRGARTLDGVPMLVHQAAIAFELWTGQPAPVRAMRDAVGDALEARA